MKPRVLCIVGPTATGKSAVALMLAERLDGEIVSADSRQVYRGLDVGTAKPTAAERARVPHHCLDLVDPEEPFDAARFRAAAAAAIDDVVSRGRVPIVAGGTGLYVRALLRGLCPAPPCAPAIRAALEHVAADEGVATLHRRLAIVDPDAAARIAPRDERRIVRALEVGLASGVPLSRWQAEHGFGDLPYDALVIGVARPRDELDARIGARADAMIAAGFVDEVRALRARGVSVGAPGLSAVGYREMRACVDGTLPLDDARAAVVRATRRFAKRQRTWFRREPDVRWYHPDHDFGALAADAAEFVLTGRAALVGVAG